MNVDYLMWNRINVLAVYFACSVSYKTTMEDYTWICLNVKQKDVVLPFEFTCTGRNAVIYVFVFVQVGFFWKDKKLKHYEMSRIPHQIFDLRPLKSIELLPPDYKINHQELIDGYLEKEVKVLNRYYYYCDFIFTGT